MTKEPQPPEVFLLKGEHIIPSLDKRITQLKSERQFCLTEIKELIKRNSGEVDADQLLTNTIEAFSAVLQPELAKGPTLSILAHLERAATVQKEHTHLMCVRVNMRSDQIYALNIDEAKRYGLY